MRENRSVLAMILTWTVVGVLTIVALKLLVRLVGFVMGLLGVALGLAAVLIFTLGPIVLLGWLATKAWEAFVREPAV